MPSVQMSSVFGWLGSAGLRLSRLSSSDAESQELPTAEQAGAREVCLKAFGARGGWHRLLERLAGLLDQWL